MRTRTLLLLLLACVAIPATAGVIRSFAVTTTSTSPFSGTAPTTTDCAEARTGTSTTGLWLAGCSAYYVCIEAAASQTLSGAGYLRADYWDPEASGGPASEWSRASQSDETLDSNAASLRRFCFPSRAVPAGSAGCGFWTPVGVTTSGGTTVTVTARCVGT